MKVQELMTERVATCEAHASLARAVSLMWNTDCGVLPVVKGDGTVIGLITDRDIAIALGTRPKTAMEIPVREVMSTKLYVCTADEDIHMALKTMRKAKVHRLPVITDGGKIVGILSLNDVALQAENFTGHKTTDLSYEDVVKTLKALCEHRHPKADKARGATLQH